MSLSSLVVGVDLLIVILGGIWYGRRCFSGSVLARGRECLFDGEVVRAVGFKGKWWWRQRWRRWLLLCLRGGACLRLFRAHFFAAPSPLSLLLFKFVLVSMGVCSGFFFFVFLGDAGDAIVVGVAGDSGTAGFLGFGSGDDTGFFPDGGAWHCLFWRGWGGACFPLFQGPHSSFWSPRSSPPGCLFWAGPDPGLAPPHACWWWWWLLCLLLLLLLWLLPFHCFQFSGGKTWQYGRFVYNPQHLERLPSIATIICWSPLIRVSGMALKPSLVRHSRNV